MNFLNDLISEIFGKNAQGQIHISRIGGGCIHQAGKFRFEDKDYFAKWNSGSLDMFETEARGLKILKDAGEIAVPEVIGHGSIGGLDYLCLSFFDQGPPSNAFWENFGRSLAALHRHSNADFGLDHDNYIGSLPQSNRQHTDWVDFFIDERLNPQIERACQNGLMNSHHQLQFEGLYEKLPELIPESVPALMHGDLWSGNFLIGAQGQPVIFDPAVYYGHREAELAFTKMFGGFEPAFYSAYQEAFPLEQGHDQRVALFNLYPLLVHVNLFGTSYLTGIESTLSRFA